MVEFPAGPAALDLDRLTQTFCAVAGNLKVPGAQLAIHHDGQTMAIEVGELEHGTGRPVHSDTAFPIGSITKSFTATVAMVLVADGEIALDSPLGEYVPELGDGAGDIGAQLTLLQLLSHTSGLSDGPDSIEVAASSIRRYVLENCRSQNLICPPGNFFSYSNLGYALVAHLIEVITGMTWWEAMESVLLRPLGIEPTFVLATGSRRDQRPIATGHSVNRSTGRIRPVEQSLMLAEVPSGGLALSSLDLVTFGLTQLEGRPPAFLPSPYAEQMRQAIPKTDAFGLADGWGLGLAMFRNGETVWVGHDGNADGTACYLRIEPLSGWVVALTSNANIGLAVWQEMAVELRRAGVPMQDHSTEMVLERPTAAPPKCVGTYLNGDTEYAVTAQEDGDVLLAIDGEVVSGLAFYEGLIFSQQDLTSGERMHAGRFLRDPVTGELDLIQVGGRLARRRS